MAERVAVGKPVVVSVNEPAEPAAKVAEAALVIAGVWSTRQREALRGGGGAPLPAVMVSG